MFGVVYYTTTHFILLYNPGFVVVDDDARIIGLSFMLGCITGIAFLFFPYCSLIMGETRGSFTSGIKF